MPQVSIFYSFLCLGVCSYKSAKETMKIWHWVNLAVNIWMQLTVVSGRGHEGLVIKLTQGTLGSSQNAPENLNIHLSSTSLEFGNLFGLGIILFKMISSWEVKGCRKLCRVIILLERSRVGFSTFPWHIQIFYLFMNFLCELVIVGWVFFLSTQGCQCLERALPNIIK